MNTYLFQLKHEINLKSGTSAMIPELRLCEVRMKIRVDQIQGEHTPLADRGFDTWQSGELTSWNTWWVRNKLLSLKMKILLNPRMNLLLRLI